MELVTRLFDPSGFPARWQCGSGWAETPWLGWLHVGSDLGIWAAYFAIPIVLSMFVLRKSDLPFRMIFVLFGAFILLCGMTHLTDAIIFWWPAYRFAAVLKLVTALVSWGTVIGLFSIIPAALALKSPHELQREIDARSLAEQQLQKLNVELERRVQLRTADLQKAIDALSAERELLQTTLKSIGDGVIVTDGEGRVTFVNAVGESLTGWRSEDAKGVQLEDVFRIVNESSREVVDNPALRALRDGVIVGLANHTILIARDGTERPIDDSAAPIISDRGVVGAVLVFRDITERKRSGLAISESNSQLAAANEALRRSEAGLQLAIAIAQMGTFEIDLQSDRVSVNKQGRKTYGWPDDEELTFAKVQSHFHHDDKADVLRQVQASLDPSGPGEFEVEQRIHRVDGEQRWLRVRGRAIFANDTSGDRAVRLAGTYLDVTDRHRLEDDLRKYAADLSDADRRKDEFLATLAHELRNPLAPIRNGLQILKLVGNNGSEAEQTRSMMERQLAQMVRLVDDLLDVSRITRNQLELRLESVQLADVLRDAMETSRPVIEARRHQLTVDMPEAPIVLKADPTRLSQVFANLLNNAAKYTEDGGSIALEVKLSEPGVDVTVRDTGVGIPSSMLERVFDMFTQVGSSRDRMQGGLGIGLTIVRSLVELHGGTVVVQSAGQGMGSAFTVHLPITDTPASRAVGPSKTEGHGAGLRILVADDNVDAANTLAMMLRLLKHEVKTAYDGQQAVEVTAEFRPDLAFLDIGMPKMTGHEAAKAIRVLPLGKPLTLVALTGWGQESDRQKSQDAGFDHHFVKPIDPTALRSLLRNLSSSSPG
ncbi:MAG: ATP-binding protein [Planctomycetaceae bacterium]